MIKLITIKKSKLKSELLDIIYNSKRKAITEEQIVNPKIIYPSADYFEKVLTANIKKYVRSVI